MKKNPFFELLTGFLLIAAENLFAAQGAPIPLHNINVKNLEETSKIGVFFDIDRIQNNNKPLFFKLKILNASDQSVEIYNPPNFLQTMLLNKAGENIPLPTPLPRALVNMGPQKIPEGDACHGVEAFLNQKKWTAAQVCEEWISIPAKSTLEFNIPVAWMRNPSAAHERIKIPAGTYQAGVVFSLVERSDNGTKKSMRSDLVMVEYSGW